jgi:hypothetical protein
MRVEFSVKLQANLPAITYCLRDKKNCKNKKVKIKIYIITFNIN